MLLNRDCFTSKESLESWLSNILFATALFAPLTCRLKDDLVSIHVSLDENLPTHCRLATASVAKRASSFQSNVVEIKCYISTKDWWYAGITSVTKYAL